MLLSARAPGRVCLLGEHCDWAGGSCLVAPLSRFVEVELQPSSGFVVRSRFGESRLGPGAEHLPEDPNRYVAAALRVAMDAGWDPPPMALVIRSNLPEGRGFSSSAALCVATLRALAMACGPPDEPGPLAELAYRAEREVLGVGCGRMDPLACAHGVPLFIRWDPCTTRPLPARRLPLVAAAYPRGRPASEILTALAANLPRVQPTIHRWGALAEAAALDLERGDLAAVGAAMNEAQDLYEALDLPELHAPWLREATRAARAAGAVGAKFTGAGGDRSVVALAPSDAVARQVGEALGALGAEVIRNEPKGA